MSEYTYVEKPFLDQLTDLDWDVIDQGVGIPTDPTTSLRASFREVLLKDIFFKSVRAINLTENGKEWLTDKQLEELYAELAHQSGTSLREINEKVQALLHRSQVDVNELTGEEYPNVKLIDFHDADRNHFLAMNQFRLDTPGCVKSFIVPDIVLFVNGIPLVVVEAKDVNQVEANPMYEAFRQLMRYTAQRRETHAAGLREGEPRLFYSNQFVIRTSGDRCEFGTVTSTDEEYFYPWRDIFPEKYRTFDPPLGKVRDQETLIQGMLPKETLLDIVRNCTIFMDVGKVRAKVVCRYQQYRAMLKIIDQLRTKKTPADRSGVIWHTQGSGKSLTMVFLIRKLRMCDDLKDFKVCLLNDRTDLEEQLGTTASLTGEKVTFINSTAELREKLSTDLSNLNMVMVHKFQEVQNSDAPEYLESALDIPKFENFGVVNSSERILLMIDEAHRSQSGDLGDNLFEAFPNATRLAFTGTPLIAVKDDEVVAQKTKKRFGQYIDKYKLQDAVEDGATVQILYEGKTADSAIDHKHEFDTKVDDAAQQHVESQMRKAENIAKLRKMAEKEGRQFDDLMKERTAEEVLELKKKWGTSGDILEADKRIQEIAEDLVNHYIDNILPNGFKAQVVCSSKMAAVKYKKFIDEALAARLSVEHDKPIWTGDPTKLYDDERQLHRDDDLCKQIAFLKSVVVISSEGTNESAIITAARKHAKEVDAVENFKRAFNFDDAEKANTGVAFLVVCDMLLTGFDAPIEQVMYIDKKVKSHNLLQTIARVNRVAKGKSRGYIIDYIGLSNHLKEALSIYAASDQKDIEESLQDISVELPVLESRYRRLINLFKDADVLRIEDFVEQRIHEATAEFEVLESAIEKMEDIKLRANFEVYLKKFMQSMDIILPNAAANPFKVPVKRFGYILVKVKERYKDDTLNISGAGEKVRKLIDEHLISLGINPKIPPVELLSPRFIQELDKNKSSKAVASEMEHAIRKHCKVKFDEDPAFYQKLSEKLEELIQQHKDNWDDLAKGLFDLRDEAKTGRKEEIEGVSRKAAPFYDMIGTVAFQDEVPYEHIDHVKHLVADILEQLEKTIDIVNFWNNPPEVSSLRGELSDLLLATGVDEIIKHSDKLVTEITQLAKKRHKDIIE
ncbi:MAG: deoxyribonuclease HsdR [Gimesia sp.]|uniref:HsdR family type I site-specific deoxyribonuclease n=1 Tax=Gimesia sp. TaxID=2024833 RepID=UPI000C3D02DD|nr:HsdR family type I site-specific deoxyribonuclease [Gimesia sp.]MAX35784.1 deoxyribonuclease HsdR [Gimesia sp.]|tara:strand:+ start:9582 stop:12968 length:3387 start_codon:yes stop_codon:yes gene_type:complete